MKRLTPGGLATFGHELRNPIHALHANLELLREIVAGGEREAQVLQRMGRQLSFLSTLVEDMMGRGAAKATAARGERLDALIADAVDTCRHLFESKGQSLRILSVSTALEVDADPLHIEQILVNLLANASRYTAPGGSIQVRGAADETGEIRIEVEDTGIGLDPEEISRIFEPRFRSSRARATNRDGVGLGLPLARRIAISCGGRITASSPGPGLGSRFTVYLPQRAVRQVLQVGDRRETA